MVVWYETTKKVVTFCRVMSTPNFNAGIEQGEGRRVGEAVRIESAGMTYTVMYGRHDTPQEHPPLENLGGIVLEGVGDRTSSTVSEAGMQDVQYRALAEEAKRLGKPIFLPDLAYDPNLARWSEERKEEMEKLLGIALLLPAVAGAGVAVADKKHPTRRAVAGGGAILSLGAAIGVLGKAAVEGGTRRAPSREDSERLVNLKNELIAQKSQTIAEKVGEVGIVIGIGHTGIEESLQARPSQRVQDVARALHDVERAHGMDVAERMRSQISLITRLDYDEAQGGWRVSVMEDESLAKLKSR